MDYDRYANFFYKTKTGIPSFMKKPLLDALLADAQSQWETLPNINEKAKIELSKRLLVSVHQLFKHYKVSEKRYNSFYPVILKQLPKIFEDISKITLIKKGRKSKSKFSFGTYDKIQGYGSDFDYLDKWNQRVDDYRKWNFSKSNTVAYNSKVTIYKAYLGFKPEDVLTLEIVTKRYRELARVKHPDVGGDANEFVMITEAKEYLFTQLGKSV